MTQSPEPSPQAAFSRDTAVPRRLFFQRRKVDRADFVVAGVQKAGTTALHYFLAKHPHVALLRDQALHFFDKEEHFAGAPDYRILHDNFKFSRRWKIAGEVTADYVYYKPAMERIATYNPQMKIIISLRNPTSRAFSHWNMRRQTGREPLEFLEAIQRDQKQREETSARFARGDAYIDRGLYTSQIERVFRFFPRSRVLLIKYESFRENYSATLDTIFDFLGIECLRGVKNTEQNVGPYQRKMTADERRYVSAIFDGDVSKLETLLNWDCSDWRLQSSDPKAAT